MCKDISPSRCKIPLRRCRPCWVVCTAAYYMHHYYCIESMHSSDRFVRPPPTPILLRLSCHA